MTVDAKILSALRAAPWGVSGAELARNLGMTRAGVWGHIEQLRESGYDIEAGPHLGYRLIGSPDALHADDLYSRLGQTRVIGREIKVFRESTSTNDVAARLARGRAAEGTVVFAEAQTKGRGPAREPPSARAARHFKKTLGILSEPSLSATNGSTR